MARIRTVKPDAWQDRRLGEVSRDARLLWVVLITMADDEGRFRTHTGTVWGHGYAHEPEAMAAIPGWLEELADAGLIEVYDAAGESFGCFPKWRSHQRISKPTPSRIPGNPGAAPGFPGKPWAAPGFPGKPWDSRAGREGKGREEEGEEEVEQERAPALPPRADECARLLEQGGVVLLDAYFLALLTEQHPTVDFAEVARITVRRHRQGGLARAEQYIRGIVTSDSPPRKKTPKRATPKYDTHAIRST